MLTDTITQITMILIDSLMAVFTQKVSFGLWWLHVPNVFKVNIFIDHKTIILNFFSILHT